MTTNIYRIHNYLFELICSQLAITGYQYKNEID